MEIHVPKGHVRSWKTFVVELGTITIGVLIALLLEGLVEWNHYRVLVREARETIHREIADNDAELQRAMKGAGERDRNFAQALRFADELLATHKTSLTSVNLGLEVAELSAASWQSAERTGALSHMNYDEVQQYSKVYGTQDLFLSRQRQTLDKLAAAATLLKADKGPDSLPADDLRLFRTRVQDLRSAVMIDEQFAQKLRDTYQKLLSK